MGADSLLSPSSTRLGRDSSQSLNKEFEDEMGDLGRSHSTSRLFQPFMADSELEDLNRKNPADTIRSSDSPSMCGPDFSTILMIRLHRITSINILV